MVSGATAATAGRLKRRSLLIAAAESARASCIRRARNSHTPIGWRRVIVRPWRSSNRRSLVKVRSMPPASAPARRPSSAYSALGLRWLLMSNKPPGAIRWVIAASAASRNSSCALPKKAKRRHEVELPQVNVVACDVAAMKVRLRTLAPSLLHHGRGHVHTHRPAREGGDLRRDAPRPAREVQVPIEALREEALHDRRDVMCLPCGHVSVERALLQVGVVVGTRDDVTGSVVGIGSSRAVGLVHGVIGVKRFGVAAVAALCPSRLCSEAAPSRPGAGTVKVCT